VDQIFLRIVREKRRKIPGVCRKPMPTASKRAYRASYICRAITLLPRPMAAVSAE
jgi:hypothetical protein